MSSSSSLSAEDLQATKKSMMGSVISRVSGFFRKTPSVVNEPIQKQSTSLHQSQLQTQIQTPSQRAQPQIPYVVIPQRLVNAFYEYNEQIQVMQKQQDESMQDLQQQLQAYKEQNQQLVKTAQDLRDAYLQKPIQEAIVIAPKIKSTQPASQKPPQPQNTLLQPQAQQMNKPFQLGAQEFAKAEQFSNQLPAQSEKKEKPSAPVFNFASSDKPALQTFNFGDNNATKSDAPKSDAQKPTFNFAQITSQEKPKSEPEPPKFNFSSNAVQDKPKNENEPPKFNFGTVSSQDKPAVMMFGQPAAPATSMVNTAVQQTAAPKFTFGTSNDEEKPKEMVTFKFGNAVQTAEKSIFGQPAGDKGMTLDFNFGKQ